MSERLHLIKPSFCVLCIAVSLLASCHPGRNNEAKSLRESIVLSEHEKLYEGLIISGFMWNVYVAKLDDLRDPVKRYWLKFDRHAFSSNHTANELYRLGTRIDWPSRSSESSLVAGRFIAKTDRLRDVNRKGIVVEIDNELLVTRMLSYSEGSN